MFNPIQAGSACHKSVIRGFTIFFSKAFILVWVISVINVAAKADLIDSGMDEITNPAYSYRVDNICHNIDPANSHEITNVFHNTTPIYSNEPQNLFHDNGMEMMNNGILTGY